MSFPNVPAVPSLRDLVKSLTGQGKAASWRDQMGPATFRGVPFFVESADYSSGRKLVVHEYPQKDLPFADDLGRKGRKFPVEGYVIGENYFTARDALIAALEDSGGPGELVHPYHGTKRVAVADFRVHETRDAGGIAAFSIEFVETPVTAPAPVATTDKSATLKLSAASAALAVAAEFLSVYNSSATLMNGVSNLVRSATLSINNVLLTVSMEKQKLAKFKQRLEDLEDSADALVNTPSGLIESLGLLFADLTDRKALLTLHSFDPGTRPRATTANRAIEQANFDATQSLIQRLVLTQAATVIADETFDSYESAITARGDLADLLDEEAESAGDSYEALMQLRADLAKAVPGDDGALRRLVAHTPPATVPSLVLAHRLYGDLESEADLLARNKIVHPGFITGGVELEVLSRE